jgi:nitrate reductase cytochrome c-type subunit
MQKRVVLLLMLVLAAVLVVGAVSAQEDMRVVDNDDFASPQRARALFNHDEHNDAVEIEDCSVCHHLYEDGKLVEDESSEDQRCSDCHELRSSDGQPLLMNAFHLRCQGCHQERKAGPVMCGECHRWKRDVSEEEQ